ncbi:MAG: TatD family hydrolase [Patescibacteria group bacterium]|nr:TatD family hydrolase [Patescibacteria group bacterium]
MLIDTHCHINFEAFNKDYQKVVDEAMAKNMKLITVGSQIETSRQALSIAHQYENVFASVGLHPTHLTDEEFIREEYLELAKDSKAVAIGETGLDYYQLWADTPEEENEIKENQKELLKKQIIISQELRKPLILHCRDAYNDLLNVLKKEKDLKAVVHCYLGNMKFAQNFLDLGLYLGFTGIITFSDDKELIKVIEKMPLERMFIETDAPYLSPEPYRGQRCRPVYVEEVAKKIAEIRGISYQKVASQTTKNAEEFFRI